MKYHTIANKILNKKSIVTLPLRKVLNAIDYTLLLLYGSEFHIARSKECGKIYNFGDYVIGIADFKDLLETISKTDSLGIERLKPFVFTPIASNKDDYTCPLKLPSIGTTKQVHTKEREFIYTLRTQLKDRILNNSETNTRRLLTFCTKGKDLEMNSKDLAFKQFVYKEVLDIDISSLDLDAFVSPIAYSIYIILTNIVPPRKEFLNTTTELCNYIKQELDTEFETAKTIVNIIEMTSRAIIDLVYEFFKHTNTELLNKIRNEPNDTLLENCIIESSRFMKFHPGIHVAETVGDIHILRNIPACQHDPAYFPEPDVFNPYRDNLDLVRKTMFFGTFQQNNLNTRSCPFQYEAFKISKNIINMILHEYRWTNMKIGFYTPNSSFILQNFYKVH